jgi:chromosome segregation ATPase
MGNDGTRRRSPWDLFAERQVHMRSGHESRYVVLSRPLQIGVAVGLLAILGLLATASYNAIAKHLELAAQERALAEQQIASAAQADRSASELATLRQQHEDARREIEQLSAALDQAQAERMAAVSASSEAGATAAELQGALAATTQARQRLAAELAESRASGASPARPGSAAGSADMQNLLAEVTGLRAELDRVNREAAALRQTATQARQALAALQGGSEILALPQGQAQVPTSDAVRQLQQDLADAQATVAGLSADLEDLKGAGSGAGPATEAAAELTTLEDQLGSAHRRAEQLGVSLAARQAASAGDVQPVAPTAAPTDAAPLPSPPAPR